MFGAVDAHGDAIVDAAWQAAAAVSPAEDSARDAAVSSSSSPHPSRHETPPRFHWSTIRQRRASPERSGTSVSPATWGYSVGTGSAPFPA